MSLINTDIDICFFRIALLFSFPFHILMSNCWVTEDARHQPLCQPVVLFFFSRTRFGRQLEEISVFIALFWSLNVIKKKRRKPRQRTRREAGENEKWRSEILLCHAILWSHNVSGVVYYAFYGQRRFQTDIERHLVRFTTIENDCEEAGQIDKTESYRIASTRGNRHRKCGDRLWWHID